MNTATELSQGLDDPLGVYLNGYADMRAYLRTVGRDQLNLISSHPLRVTACVLLHEARKDGTYIKLRLRWLSNCFEIYLRNSDIIMAQHESALAPFHEQVKHFALDLVELLEPEDDLAGTTDNADFPMDDAEDIDLESV